MIKKKLPPAENEYGHGKLEDDDDYIQRPHRYAIEDKEIIWELRDFCMSTYEWQEFFAADGVTDHRE